MVADASTPHGKAVDVMLAACNPSLPVTFYSYIHAINSYENQYVMCSNVLYVKKHVE